MSKPTRADLEAAASAYFSHQAEAQDRPRDLHPERLDEDVAYRLELANQGINLIDEQLIRNEFAGNAHLAASGLLEALGTKLDDLGETDKLVALQMGARVIRELSLLFVHRLTEPVRRYQPHDELFLRPTPPPVAAAASPPSRVTSIRAASEAFGARQRARKLGASTLTETTRVLNWLADRFGSETDIATLTPDDLKHFRDDLTKVDSRLKGRSATFDARLTEDPASRIQYPTYSKYWRSLQQFFRWAVEDKILDASPADIAAPPKPKGLKQKSPEPFTADELVRLFQTPLYAGHKSVHQVMSAGHCVVRCGKWWSGVVLMHTGLRAGELSQLVPDDFACEAPVPHLRVHDDGTADGIAKTVKNQSSIRDVPLHPDLIALGLEAFVALRRKANPSGRVFREFRLGKHRKSEGVTRFWGDYLTKQGLWKEGRSTHVWRHTVARNLRDNGVRDEDIAAVVGHSGGEHGQTKAYGGGYSLDRKLKTILALDYGFDVVAALGGPYNAQDHRA